ncbi:hypothetical protein J4Q44_G00298530 [Coregonus suidteri]|uniref:DDE Tnp4 domain-containing protein n=1 Tax=Coregonus suidteri TaxID=861788 RepID=A0AAN8L282_9TELE
MLFHLFLRLWLTATVMKTMGISDRFDVSKSTVKACFQRVIEAVSHLSARVIVWPTGAGAQEVISGFATAAKFPGVIGAIDGTHIPIKAPREYPETNVNQKSFHSMHLQAVCDNKMIFTSVLSAYPDSGYSLCTTRYRQ